MPFFDNRAQTKKRHGHVRQRLTEARSGRRVTPEEHIDGLERKVATSSPQSVLCECPGRRGGRSERVRRSSVGRLDSAATFSRQRQPSVDASRPGGRSSTGPCRRRKFNWRIEGSDSELLCDEEQQFLSTSSTQRQRGVLKQTADTTVSDRLEDEDSARPACPFGFPSLSSIRSLLSTNSETEKRDSREYRQQKYKHSGSYDFICPSGSDSESGTCRRFTQGSCRDLLQKFLACRPTSTASEIRAKTSSAFGFLTTGANSTAHSKTLDQRRSGSVVKTAHGVNSSTDKPSEAFNNADVGDLSPDLVVNDSRHSPDDKPVDGQGSRHSSTDRPAGSFNIADLIASSPVVGSSSYDSRRPLTAGVHVEHGDPSVVSRRPLHLYSDCTDCPQCLSYVLCGVCNTLHQPDHDVDVDYLPLASDLCDRDFLTGNDVSDPVSMGRYASCSAELGSSDSGTVQFLDGPTAACVVGTMDLHSFVDRDTARSDDCEWLSRTPRNRSCSRRRLDERPSEMACVRRRCLHFYTDCSDCPDCCSTVVRGSCCSVHGPPLEPADLSPRCAKRRPDDDNSRTAADVSEVLGDMLDRGHELPTSDDSATRTAMLDLNDVKAGVPEDSALKDSNTDDTAGNETSITDTDNSAPSTTPAPVLFTTPVEHNITKSLDVSPVTADPMQLASSGDAADDEECWTVVEKVTCGALALLIFIVFFAIYLQLTRRHFTGVYNSI